MKKELPEIVEKGRKLVNVVKEQESQANKEKEDALWKKIGKSIDERNRKHRFRIISITVAASVIACIGVASVYFINNREQEINIQEKYSLLSEHINKEADKVTLTLSDNKQIVVNEDADVVYSKDGTIYIDSDPVAGKPVEEKKLVYNRIYVPKGKMSKMILEDGTVLYINSGTLVIYPVPFEKKKRELYIEGEVYAEVAKDASKLFIIRTEEFDVRVTGTSFNISAYKRAEKADVVLVEGAVEVTSKNDKIIQMSPNQQLIMTSGQPEKLKKINAANYISWTKRILIFNAEELINVLQKLELYYGVEFEYDKENIQGVTLNGKLDLKESIEKTMHNISVATKISYNIKDNVIIIKNENN